MRMKYTESEGQQCTNCEHEQFQMTEFVGACVGPTSPITTRGGGMTVSLHQLIEDVNCGHIEEGSR